MQRVEHIVADRKLNPDPPEVLQASRILDMVRGWDALSRPDDVMVSRIIIRLEDLEENAVRGDCKEMIQEAKKVIWQGCREL